MIAEGEKPILRDYDVVNQRDSQKPPGVAQASRSPSILGARFRISARVIMSDHDGRRVVYDSRSEYFSGMYERRRQRAHAYDLAFNKPLASIKIERNKMFLLFIRPWLELLPYFLRRVEYRTDLGLGHDRGRLGQLERGSQKLNGDRIFCGGLFFCFS